jgi:berberine-like enzyme
MVSIAAMYERPDEATTHEPWDADFAAALRQGDGGAYVGFLGDDGQARVRDAFPNATWERLIAVKKPYDPSNLYRLTHNVRPS